MDSPGPARTSVRQELLVSTAVLFLGGVLVAVAAVALTLPLLDSSLQAAVFIGGIVVADLAILVVFLRSLLLRSVFGPLERIGEHAERIAAGSYDPRIPPEDGEELDRLIRGLNVMAEKFISDQDKLSENVRSLDRTNQELVATTEELVRAARMASVGALASGVAHEVGNPLGALMGCLDVLKRRIELGGDLASPLESAVEEADRIDRIVRSILDFARPGGEQSAHPEVVSVPDVLARSLDLLEGRGATAGIEVTQVVELGVLSVRGRAQHLEQIFLNLLMNAIWAVRDRPSPEIRVRVTSEGVQERRIESRRADDPPGVNYSHRRRIPLLIGRGTAREAMEAADGAREVVVRVEDNGPGVPPDRLPSLFDPFFTTKAPGEGSGLGLTITARIVQELGGTVDAENQEGGGARFTVRIPQAMEETT
jgi:two-component system NtrC family sensor kinase